MAFALRPPRLQRNRRKRPCANVQATYGLEFTTPNIVMTFDLPVVLNGVPQLLTDTGKLPTGATQVDSLHVSLAYDTPGGVTEATLPSNDPAIRTMTGGYAAAGTFPAP